VRVAASFSLGFMWGSGRLAGYKSLAEFLASFLDFLAAFFSLGLMAGFFFSALMLLCSLLMVVASLMLLVDPEVPAGII